MEIELATTADIVRELQRRNLRFVFVSLEHTNSERHDRFCLAGQGADTEDLMSLMDIGYEAFEELDDDQEMAD